MFRTVLCVFLLVMFNAGVLTKMFFICNMFLGSWSWPKS